MSHQYCPFLSLVLRRLFTKKKSPSLRALQTTQCFKNELHVIFLSSSIVPLSLSLSPFLARKRKIALAEYIQLFALRINPLSSRTIDLPAIAALKSNYIGRSSVLLTTK
jgi:hypothetical protein